MRVGQLLWTQWPPLGPHQTTQSELVEHWGSIRQATGVTSAAGASPGPVSEALRSACSGTAPGVLAIVAAIPAAMTNRSPIHAR
jgi:hypothetical protein